MTREQSIKFHLQVAFAAGVVAGRDGVKDAAAAGEAVARELVGTLERDLEQPSTDVVDDPMQRLWRATDGRRCADCPLPLIAHRRGITGHDFAEAEHALEAAPA